MLTELAANDPRLIVLYGDVACAGMSELERQSPKQIANFGICEQAMMGAAAGMAFEGMRPVVYSITPFIIERAFEWMKLELHYMQARVLVVTYDSYPVQKVGPTQSPVDARELMNLLPGIRSWYPANGEEAEQAIRQAVGWVQEEGPAFVHLTRDPEAK
jgi:transketolase